MQQKVLNNRYELEQKIGEGGMARVYRGRDLRLNRQVALKVLHSHYASDSGFLQRFHHEAQAAANLRHPNIVDVYDVGQDDDIHYIVMEYVQGSDLKAVILRNGPLPIEQAVYVAECVANGLEAAHRIGMVHRDIKPQNIIVGEQGQVKITDFGIAKSSLSTALTETGVTFGTADYISSEQARGQPATPRSDIYSLGVTLYEMLTARLPFTGESAIAVAMQHVSADPPPPRMYNPRIPPQLESLVLRALSKDPDGRPTTAREFARLLQGYRNAGDQATVVGPVAPPAAGSPPRPAPRPAPRPVPQPSARPIVTGNVSPRAVMPASRPAVVAQAPPDNRGMGFGGFILGLLLLAGVLGLVYLLLSGAFNGLFSFTSGVVRPPVAATVVAETPTEAPTASVPQVPVPDVLGKSEAEARTAIQAAGLSFFQTEPKNSDVVTTGLVMEQTPPPNMPVNQSQSTIVTFTVSLGSQLVDVPDVQRMRAQDAQNALGALGFQVRVQQEPSTMSEGFVTRQDPVDVKLPKGDTITIFVSIGDKVVMPDVTGKTVDEAKRLIAAAGLPSPYPDIQSCEKLGADICARFAPGQVVSSVPRGGDQVARGTAVTIGVRAP
jgi:beta-lactam-binding protein with PASTA domain